MQIKNNYQIEWRLCNQYGIPIDKGTGVFNGDTGVIREINLFAELLTVEFDEGSLWITASGSWKSWNWLMPSQSTNPREVSIRPS